MNTVRTGIVALALVCLVGCSSQTLSRSDAQATLIELAESRGKPLALTVPGLRSGNIRYMTGREEGISPGIWNVNLSKKTFLFLVANDSIFHSYSGVFQKTQGKWQAVIVEENSGHRLPNN